MELVIALAARTPPRSSALLDQVESLLGPRQKVASAVAHPSEADSDSGACPARIRALQLALEYCPTANTVLLLDDDAALSVDIEQQLPVLCSVLHSNQLTKCLLLGLDPVLNDTSDVVAPTKYTERVSTQRVPPCISSGNSISRNSSGSSGGVGPAMVMTRELAEVLVKRYRDEGAIVLSSECCEVVVPALCVRSPRQPTPYHAKVAPAWKDAMRRAPTAHAFYGMPTWGAPEAMVQVRQRRKYAVMVHDSSAFSNGCIQNGFFLKVALEAAGFPTDLVAMNCASAPPGGTFKFGGVLDEVRVLGENPTNASAYHTMVWMTRMPGLATVRQLRGQGVQLIGYNCGNVYMFDQEEWLGLRPPRANDPLHTAYSRVCQDEQWTIPFLAPLLAYLNTVGKQPGHVVPHLWAPDVLAASMGGRPLPRYSPLGRSLPDADGMEIVIMEPNVSIVKTSWLPLVIAENLYLSSPNLVNTVHVLCMPQHAVARAMLAKLTIAQDKKVQTYERLPMTQVLSHFGRSTRPVVFLCHQHLNNQNYVYYELLHLGWPLVHNSDAIKGAGYYYPAEDITAGAAQLINAARSHAYRSASYEASAKAVLDAVDPRNATTVAAVKQVADGSFAKHMSSEPKR